MLFLSDVMGTIMNVGCQHRLAGTVVIVASVDKEFLSLM